MLNRENLPPVIEKYLAASEKKDAEGFAALFSEDARYYDDGETFLGRNAIRDWKQDFDRKLSVVNTLLAVSGEGENYRLEVEASGNFPGSPQVFVQHLSLDAQRGLIRELKIE